jgi:hypothetical protein
MQKKTPPKQYRYILRRGFNRICERLDRYSNLISLFTSVVVAVATIALAIITYFQINESREMRIETKRLVDTGIEQFKIKSYPDLSVVFRPISHQSNDIIQVLEIRNRGEITAFNVTHLLVQVYEKDSHREFVNLFSYKESEEVRNSLRFKFNISPDATKIISKRDSVPDKWTFDSLKGALLFIRFEVPYDNKYRYKTIAYQLKKNMDANEPGVIYRMYEMDSIDSDILIKQFIDTPSTITDTNYNDIKTFFKDYELKYK